MCWHLTDPGSLIFNNAFFFGRGWITTASFLVERAGADFVTGYQMFNRQPEKEALWERIRVEEAPNAPSRMGSMYLFESEADADEAMTSWFATQTRIKLQVLALSPPVTTLFRADSNWLNHSKGEWEEAACQYWRGMMSSDPKVELLAHGRVFLPGWGHPPFGPMMPVPRS